MAKTATRKSKPKSKPAAQRRKRKARPEYQSSAPAAWKVLLASRLRSVFGAISNREIASRTNHNHETVRRFMASGSPSVAFLVEVARAYGVSVDWLLGLKAKR